MKKNVVHELLTVCALLGAASSARAQFSAPAVLPGDVALAPPAGNQTNVAFARGGDQILMVWEDTRASLAGTQSVQGYGATVTDVYAARLDGAGNRIDVEPIAVATGPFSQTLPKVAWNGSSWLVVWASRTPSPYFTTQGVYGARVSPVGAVLDAPPIAIADSPDFDEFWPVVSSDGADWFVVWRGTIAQGTDAIVGCAVSAAGVPGAPQTYFATVGGVGYYIPWNFELAFAAGRYLLVYEHMLPGRADDDVLGQLFDTSLAKVGGELSISTNTWNQVRAAVASNGSSFFVTWHDEQMWGEVRGSPVLPDGSVVVPDGVVYQTGMYGSYPIQAAGWDGMHRIAAWERGGPLMVARVSTSGAMLPGSPFPIEPAAFTMVGAAVATTNTGALVGWSDPRNSVPPYGDTADLYGALIDAVGTVSTSQPLALSVPAQVRPDLAGSEASGYLAVFLSLSSPSASVMAQRVDAFGNPIDSQPFVLESVGGTWSLRHPCVAWNGSLWLVAWEGVSGIRALRVGANGAALDAAPFTVLPGNTPDVAAIGDLFLVVSSHEFPDHYRPIKAARVRASDGVVLDGTPLVVGSSYSVAPTVTAFADRWLLAYEQHNTHDETPSRVYASFVLPDGTQQGSVLAGQSSGYNTAPALSVGGSVALLAWADGTYTRDVRGRRIRSDGVLLDSSAGFIVSSAPNQQFSPEAGWDGARWLVAWNDYRAHASILDGGVGDLFAARVEADGTVLDPSGLAVANEFAVPEGNPTVAGDAGNALAAYAAVHVGPPYGTFRITLRAGNGSSAIASYCYGDGSAGACPCGNGSVAGEGCAGSQGSGAVLTALGAISVAADELRFQGWQFPANTSALLFQGDVALPGALLGDGLRCVATNVVRLGARPTGAGGVAVWGPGLATSGGWIGGQTKHFQGWYRNPAGPCGAGSNLTNAVSVGFAP